MNSPVPVRSVTSTQAIISLVFGVLSWVALPFVGAIVAVICGHMARGDIRRAPADQPLDGDGLAIAGMVLGYAQLAFCLLVVVLVAVAVMLGFIHQ